MPYATNESGRFLPPNNSLLRNFREKEIKKLQTPAAVVKEYLRDCSLHGVRYTVKEDEGIFSRIIWIIIVILCISCAIFFILTAWQSFTNSPVVTHVADTYYPLIKLPFPAVTVCPAYSIKKRLGTELLLKQVTDDLKDDNLNNSLFHLMRGLSFLRYPLYHLIPHEFEQVKNLTYYDKVDITDFMMKVLPTHDDLFDKCFWEGEEENCSEIFTLQRYEGGFCYSFNSYTSDVCNLEKLEFNNAVTKGLYLSKSSIGGFSLYDDSYSGWLQAYVTHQEAMTPDSCEISKSGAAGTGTGLEVHFRSLHDEDHLGIGPQDLKGLRVMIHEASQIPQPGIGLFMLDGAAKIGRVRVQPSVTESSNTLRSLTPQQRNCYFGDESSLTIAPEYSQDNCFIECRLLFIIKVCKCQPYFFNFAYDTVPECSILEFKCMVDNYKNLKLSQTLLFDNVIQTEDNINCSQCLPSCDSMDYDTDSVFAEETKPIINQSLGYLNVFYKDQIAVMYVRAPAVDTMNLLVSFGGIAGLFLGFSILSAVEMFYYIFKWIKAMCSSYVLKSANLSPKQPTQVTESLRHHYIENFPQQSSQQKWRRMRHNWALELY